MDNRLNQCATIQNESWLRDRFTKNLQEIFASCQDLIVRKNADYTKISPQNPFHNFEQEAVSLFVQGNGLSDKIDGITLGLLTRLNDKRRRRENLLLTSGSLVIDESIEDTIKDEINYLAILLCHLMINGRHKIQAEEAPQRTFTDMELEEARKDIHRLYKALDEEKRMNIKLNSQIAKVSRVKAPKSVNRNSKPKH